MNKVLRLITCSASCISRIPWWAWIVIILAGAILGALTYLVGVLTAGTLSIVVAALAASALQGIMAAIAATFVVCIRECIKSILG